MNDFGIGILVAAIAIVSIFFSRNSHNDESGKNTRLFFLTGVIAAVFGVIGYAFLGWRY